MRRGLTLSILLHLFMGVLIIVELPSVVLPEREVKLLNVKIASSPAKVVKSKKKAKIKKPKKVYSQQSQAPKYAKKKKVEKVKSKSKTKVVKKLKKKSNLNKKTIKKKVEKKSPPPQKKAQKEIKAKEQISSRPEKLDKTWNKKNIIKSDNKKDKKAKKEMDDFLNTLDFIEDWEEEQKGVTENLDGDSGQVYEPDQIEMAKIRKAVEKNWYKTAGASKLNKLTAVVEVQVDRDGTVNKVKLIESSGKGYFDRSLMRAIKKASPLPIPSDKYEIYKTILLTFKG